MGLGHRLPLVGVDTDAQRALLLGDLDEGAVAGLAAGAEHDVGAVVERLAGRRGPELGVGEGHVETARVVRRDDVDVRVGVLGAVLEALLEGDDRRHLVGAEHGGDRVGLGQQPGEGAGEEARLVLVEDQAGEVADDRVVGLELVDADEHDVGVGGGRRGGRLAEGEAGR